MRAPTHTTERVTRLAWDSSFFGLSIGRAVPPLDAGAGRAVAGEAMAGGIDCVYLLVPAGDVQTVQAAEAAGFRTVDLRLTFVRDVAPPAPAVPPDGVIVREARSDDVAALRMIAREAHRDARFHVDATFGAERASALYEHWIATRCSDASGVVLVPDEAGTPIGYLTCERDATGDGRSGLVAVADHARGRGIGRAMLTRALLWFADAGISRVRVVTQGRNFPAQRLYQTMGFRTESLETWLHLWSRPGGARSPR